MSVDRVYRGQLTVRREKDRAEEPGLEPGLRGPKPRVLARYTTPQWLSLSLRRDALRDHQVRLRRALPDREQLLVLSRLVPAHGRVDISELEHDQPLRRPRALPHRDLAAAGQVAAAVALDRRGRAGGVLLVE